MIQTLRQSEPATARPQTLPGFGHIQRAWDKAQDRWSARLRSLDHGAVVSREKQYLSNLRTTPAGNDVELF
jgi:hypothetical protein